MAKAKEKPKPRKPTKRKPAEPSALTPANIEAGLGVLLIVMAIGTLLSLVFPRGELTDAWLRLLRGGLGWAFVFSPFWLGGLGLLLLFDSFDQRPDIRWEQVWGLFIMFLAGLGLLQMAETLVSGLTFGELTAAGRGGGFAGEVIASGLMDALGAFGAFFILLLGMAVGVALAARPFLPALMTWLNATIAQVSESARHARLPINPGREPVIGSGAPSLDDIPIRSAGRPIDAPSLPPPPLARVAPPLDEPLSRPPIIIGGEDLAAPTRPVAPALPPEPPAPTGPKPVVTRPLGDRDYQLPSIAEVLEENTEQEISRDEIRQKARIIEETLAAFGVPTRVIEVNQGPAITQFGLEPGFIEKKDTKGQVTRSKVKVSKISSLQDDLALALSAPTVRIEAPVPGRNIVGIEVPNSKSYLVSLRGVIESESFQKYQSEGRLGVGLGQDVSGSPVAIDLTRMPHMLIAGATGSGKSVCINAIIASLLLTHTPQTLRFLMVDPKRVELVQYNGIPHLLTDVIVDVENVTSVLQLALREMDRRYREFAKRGVRNIDAFNAQAASKGEKPMPFILLIVDELADLMMVAPEEVERSVCRLAQMARATGIHLILATQRPSVDVVTGLIKANFPARIAFAVTSQVDSRVILDTVGADKLLGRGDMLYMAPDASKLQRLQGCYVADRELDRLVRYWKGMGPRLGEGRSGGLPQSLADEDRAAIPDPNAWPPAPPGPTAGPTPTPGARLKQPSLPGFEDDDADEGDLRDELWDKAIEEVKKHKTASASLLQRKLRIGYQRAARLIEDMEKAGVLGPPEGPSRARPVLGAAEDQDNDDTW